jgi:hypothetical protein
LLEPAGRLGNRGAILYDERENFALLAFESSHCGLEFTLSGPEPGNELAGGFRAGKPATAAIDRGPARHRDPPATHPGQLIGGGIALFEQEAKGIGGGILRGEIIVQNRAGDTVHATTVGGGQALDGADLAVTKGFTEGWRLKAGRRTHIGHSVRLTFRLLENRLAGKRSKSSPIPDDLPRSANERKDSRRP